MKKAKLIVLCCLSAALLALCACSDPKTAAIDMQELQKTYAGCR